MSANVMKDLEARAKADPQRVVLPEAGEEKILRAARQVQDQGLGLPILIGEPDSVRAASKAIGLSVEDMPIVDPSDETKIEYYAAKFSEANPDYPARAVKRMLRDPLNFAAMMVKFDDADCMVAGLSHTTGEVIMAAQMILGMSSDITTASSMGIMSIPGYEGQEGNLLVIADCAVCAAPGSTELADIAISTADTVKKLLGWEPRVALLSFSTKGSAGHERVDMVLEALRLVHERRPQLLIDGELQLDAAIVPKWRRGKSRRRALLRAKPTCSSSRIWNRAT